MNWTRTIEMTMMAVVAVGVAIILWFELVKPIIKKFRQKEEEEKEMSRGGILISSIFIELVVITVVCVVPWFLPIGTFWKILIISAGFSATLIMDFFLIYFWWAPNNLFWTFVPEGRAKIVVRADEVRNVLIQWRGHVLATKALPDENIDVWDIVEGDPPKRRFGGLRFYGFWPLDDIYVYDFSWTNIAQNGAIEAHERETLGYMLLKEDVYLAMVAKAEDADLLPVDIKLVLTMRVVSPYKAGFVIQNWLEAVINRIKPVVRDTFTQNSYKEWISAEKDLADIIINDPEVKHLLEEECRARYGVEVKAIEVMDIDPGEEYRADSLAEYLAKRQKARVIIEAEGERERLKKVAQGEAQRIKIVNDKIKEYGDLGKLIRTLEALEKSPGQGSKLIVLPGVTDLISQVFPGRQTVGPKEIKEIMEMLKKIQGGKSEKKAS